MLTFEVTGDAEPPDPKMLAEAAGAAYVGGADGACTGRPLREGDALLATKHPAALLPGLLGAEEAGSDTTNGVAAGHYTFDGRALLEAGGPVTSGEVWVATDGGHVLRFLRTTNADAGYFGGGLAGEMTWDYELTDVNTLTNVAMPDGCQLDTPVMDDALNLLILPEYLGFDTPSSVADAMQFYQVQLSAEGWAVAADPTVSDDTAVADFTKSDKVVHVIVTTTDAGTHVDLAVTAAV